MELVKKEDKLISAISEIENTRKMCEMLMKTPHYSKLGADGIYAVVAKARSLDIDPFDALNGALYYVKGRVGMSTEAMAARMRAAGHSITKDPKSTNTCCILNGKRADNGDTWSTSFSIDDAKRAGIYSDGSAWGKYPSVMCYNRAMSMMFRQMTPDLSKGAGYTLDELKEIAHSKGNEESDSQETIAILPIQEDSPITFEQALTLESIFSECDPTYIDRVWKTLRNKSINTFGELPASLYDRIRNAAEKNRSEFQKQKQKAENAFADELDIENVECQLEQEAIA